MKGEKCKFRVKTASFLGYIIEQGNLQLYPVMVKALVDWPEPTDRHKPQRFLGFANFYLRFFRDFSKVALPQTRLTSPKVLNLWDDAAQVAFTCLKEWFASAPSLSQPDLTLQFMVEVDPVLSQQRDGKLHPCAFFCEFQPPSVSFLGYILVGGQMKTDPVKIKAVADSCLT